MKLLPFNSAFLFLCLVRAMHNCTIDDTNSSIVYQPEGSWDPDQSQESSLDYEQAHTVSEDPNATATFIFVGVAIYYMSPLWPFQIGVTITLDNKDGQPVNLTDPSSPPASTDSAETVPSQPVWWATGLPNTTHQVVVSMGASSEFVVVDGFNYTVLDAEDISTTTSPVSSSSPVIAPSPSVSDTTSFLSSTLQSPPSSLSTIAASSPASDTTSSTPPPAAVSADSSPTSASRVTHNSTPLIAGTVSGLVLVIAIVAAVWIRHKLDPKPHLSDFGPHLHEIA